MTRGSVGSLRTAEPIRYRTIVAELSEALTQIIEWEREDGHDGHHSGACNACQRVDLAQRALAKAQSA